MNTPQDRTPDAPSAAKIKVHPVDCECESCEEFERLAAESAAYRASSAAQGRPEAAMGDAELLAKATERPWYFDGWDIFTSGSAAGPRGDGHRLVVPLSHLNETFHESQQVSRYDAELIVRAVNAYVGR